MNAVVASETRALSELLARLGGVPIERVRLRWPLGEVTEEEWIEANKSGRFELVDGVLVEKAMGWFETRLGFILGMIVETFVAEHDLGFVVVETGATRIEGQTRMPDVAFFPWTRFPDRRVARTAALGVAPDFVVEVLRPSNTAAEMERKRRECFAAGTRLVWEIEPELTLVRVYADAGTFVTRTASDELTGEPVLPGFRLGVQALFDRTGFLSPNP